MVDLSALNQQYGRPGKIDFVAGRNGLPVVEINNAAGSASVSLYGGQILSFRSAGDARDMLFVSDRAFFVAGRAIRGGIPICWPWLGDDPAQPGRGAHGFARKTLWQVASVDGPAATRTDLVLELHDDAASRAIWALAFRLSIRISVADSLTLELVSENRAAEAVSLTQALHTYFAVTDIQRTCVEGLHGLTYLDKLRDFRTQRQTGAVTFAGEVDRIYQGVSAPLTVVDAAGGRRIRIEAQNSRTAAVWNPGQTVARSMPDLDDLAYRNFVCVETANAADDVIHLEPGQQSCLRARYGFV